MFYAKFYEGDYKEAQHIILERLPEIKLSSNFKAGKRNYLLACIFFMMKDFAKALNYLKRINPIESSDQGWSIEIRILEILTLIELNELEEATSKIENLRRLPNQNHRIKLISSVLQSLSYAGYEFKPVYLKEQGSIEMLTSAQGDLVGLDQVNVEVPRSLAGRGDVDVVLTVDGVAATFGAYWALSLGLTWFTPFIVQGLGFSQKDAGLISVLPWVFGASIVLLTGWISQVMLTKGYTTRGARGVLGAAPLVLGGCILAVLPQVSGIGLQVALLVIGSGLCGSIYVVCPPMLGEFTPVSQRGAIISIYGALYTLAGIIAPITMGSVIKHATTPLEGYMTGFTINAAIMVASGVLGLLLLWPNSERARLNTAAAQPRFA